MRLGQHSLILRMHRHLSSPEDPLLTNPCPCSLPANGDVPGLWSTSETGVFDVGANGFTRGFEATDSGVPSPLASTWSSDDATDPSGRHQRQRQQAEPIKTGAEWWKTFAQPIDSWTEPPPRQWIRSGDKTTTIHQHTPRFRDKERSTIKTSRSS